MGNNGFGKTCIVAAFCVATAIASHAQTFGTLLTFNDTDGALPVAALIQGTNGNLYGTNSMNGQNGMGAEGSIFEIAPGGQLVYLHSFCSQTNCTDGASPSAPLVQATTGIFYGTTKLGGANNAGTVFQINSSLEPRVRSIASALTPTARTANLRNPDWCKDPTETITGRRIGVVRVWVPSASMGPSDVARFSKSPRAAR